MPSSSCGHLCCQIADNAYHVHAEPPPSCPRCAALGEAEPVALGRLVAEVLLHVAPEIPGLPGGAALAALVGHHALDTYRAARDEPAVRALRDSERRAVLAARVGLALAFPAEFPGTGRGGPPR